MQAQTFVAEKSNYTIYYAKGKVAGKDKHLETIISGSGGGGGSYQGTGGTAPISISSRTVIHDKIFIEHENGKQTAVELTGWDIACLQGHELLAAWIIKNNEEKGPYVAIKNFTTDDEQISAKKIKELADHHYKINSPQLGCLLILVGIGIIGGLLYYIGGGILLAVGMAVLIGLEMNIREKSKKTEGIITKELRQFLKAQE
ncbi:MAG: hypothetical protein WDM90_14040 [Ferruginibacter sp.]